MVFWKLVANVEFYGCAVVVTIDEQLNIKVDKYD